MNRERNELLNIYVDCNVVFDPSLLVRLMLVPHLRTKNSLFFLLECLREALVLFLMTQVEIPKENELQRRPNPKFRNTIF